MQVSTGKLQILTVAAMLVLLSGGIAAYAQNQPASSSIAPAGASPIALADSTDSTSTTSTSSTSSTGSTTTVTSTVTATTTATSTTTTANYTLCTPPTTAATVGRLVLPITPTTQPVKGSISFSDSRGCVASITSVGGVFNVQVILRYAKPVTQYNVVLVANGTNYALGSMVTGQDGAGQIQNQVLLKTGTYVVSLQIFDTSSTPGQSTLVLQTGQGTIVSPPFPTPSTSNPQSNQGDQGHSGQKR